MKSVPSRSPSRRSSPPPPPPPPPRMSHRSPSFRRGRSPERRRRPDSHVSHSRMSPPRSRERREFRTSPRSDMSFGQSSEFPGPRRSRSPMRESKRRSYSPKRKSPKRDRDRRDPERERPVRSTMSRKRSRSKSPAISVGPSLLEDGSRLGVYSGPSDGPSRGYEAPDYPSAETVIEVRHSSRSATSVGDRFAVSSPGCYEDHAERSVLQGPKDPANEMKKGSVELSQRPIFQGSERASYDINELKKMKMEVPNRVPSRWAVLNLSDINIVRRPDMSLVGDYSASLPHRLHRAQLSHVCRTPSPKRHRLSPWEEEEANGLILRSSKSEGIKPIFAREEIIRANERMRSGYEAGHSSQDPCSVPTDHERVAAIAVSNPAPPPSSGGPRYESPARASRPPPSYYGSDREHSGPSRDYVRPRDYDRGSGPSMDPRDKSRDEHYERRDDPRYEVDTRRREDTRYSSHGDSFRAYDKGREYRENDRGSDLRMRIHEKRSDRHEDHEMGYRHPMERHDDRERERDRRMPSPTPERRRGPIDYSHMGDGERKVRGDMRMGPSGRRADSYRFHQGPEFGPRQERFHTSRPWEINPEYVPKGRAYFEHDNRDEMRIPNRGRGMMDMRGRGSFGRMMRGRPPHRPGMSRGYMGGRGMGRRGGYVPRYKPSSPHWEHDLFDTTSPGHGNNGFTK